MYFFGYFFHDLYNKFATTTTTTTTTTSTINRYNIIETKNEKLKKKTIV